MAKKKLNLLQLATGRTAEASATSAEVVGRKFADADLAGELLHDMPDELLRDGFAPNPTCATHPPEKATRANSCGRCPVIQQAMHPIRGGNGPNVTTLSPQVHDCPMPFALLKVAHGQAGELVPTESTGEKQGKQRSITFALDLLLTGCLPERLPLFGRQPVAEPNAQLFYALDTPYASRQVGSQEAAIGRLICEPADGPETKVDGSRSEIPVLDVIGTGRPPFC